MGVNQDKANKVLSKSFVENHANITEDEAASVIVKSEQTIKQLEEERQNDEKLAIAKQIIKDLGAGYSSAIKYEKAKISFLLEKIEEIQSGNVNPDSGVNI